MLKSRSHFWKQDLRAWDRALRTKRGSKQLIGELLLNLRIHCLQVSVYRAIREPKAPRKADKFDAPLLERQLENKSRFHPLVTNCLYTANDENTAALESLCYLTSIEETVYVAELEVVGPIKVLFLTDKLRYVRGLYVNQRKPNWDYFKAVWRMCMGEDELSKQTSCLLAKRLYEAGVDGIAYFSRAEKEAWARNGKMSAGLNFVIFGAPLEKKLLRYNKEKVRAYGLRRA